MKQISVAMQEILKSEAVRMCWLFRLKRRDGVEMGFTSHDRDIVIDGFRYEASGALMPSTMESASDAAVNNLSADGILSSDLITERDLTAGRYDGATLAIMQCDWSKPQAGVINHGTMLMDKISYRNGGFKADLLSGKNAIQRVNGKLIDERCAATFGDHECKYNVSALDVLTTVAVGTVDGANIVTAAADAPYAYGYMTIVGGEWDGVVREIKSFKDGTAVLWTPFPAVPSVGQQIRLRQGCDKTAKRCKALANFLNFRGFPTVPGIDAVSKTPDSKSSGGGGLLSSILGG